MEFGQLVAARKQQTQAADAREGAEISNASENKSIQEEAVQLLVTNTDAIPVSKLGLNLGNKD
jgi:2-keto-4-pentenoate hydratase